MLSRVAAKNDPTAASEFAAVRAHDAGASLCCDPHFTLDDFQQPMPALNVGR